MIKSPDGSFKGPFAGRFLESRFRAFFCVRVKVWVRYTQSLAPV
jgi:hypothetical protein